MTDNEITELLTNRDQRGLSELKTKYQKLILKVCRDCLRSAEDAEECANDTVLALWEKIPPDRPENLAGYICRIARRKAVDKLRYNTAAIRNSDLLTELDECLPSEFSIEEEAEKSGLRKMLNAGLTPTAATTALSRLRASLKKYLTERGLFYE